MNGNDGSPAAFRLSLRFNAVIAVVVAAMAFTLVSGCTDSSSTDAKGTDSRPKSGQSAVKGENKSANSDSTGGSSESSDSKGTNTTDPAVSTPEGVDAMPIPVVGPAVAPVGMDETASFGNGVSAVVAATESLEVTAARPGETSGAATAVTVKITNGSPKAIDLTNVTVDLTDSEGRSFSQIDSAKQHADFKGQLKADDTVSATYVFRVEPQERSNTYLTVKYATDTPTVVFAGSIIDD